MSTDVERPTIIDIRDAHDDLERLDGWVDAGLLTAEQADAIREHERDRLATMPPPALLAPPSDGPDVEPAPPPPQRRISLVAEALGYLGVALVGVAATILLTEIWEQLRYGARLGLVVVLTLVVGGAGAYARRADEPAFQRLASFSWALTIGGIGWLAFLLGGENGIGLGEERLGLAVVGSMAAGAWALYRLEPRWLQHVVTYATTLSFVVVLLLQPEGEIGPFYFGVALTALALVWVLLGAARMLPPDPASQWVGLLGLLIGLNVLSVGQHQNVGLIVALVATAGLLLTGVVAERTLYLGFGAAAVFLFVPQTVFYFFGDTLGAPVVLLIVGVLLLATALGVVRLRGAVEEPRHEGEEVVS